MINLLSYFVGSILWMLPLLGIPQSIEQDTILAKHYDEKEIDQLRAIVSFFDKYMLNACQRDSNIEACYQQFFDRLSNPNSFNIGIPFEDQSIFYLKDLDQKLFHSIWSYSPSRTQTADDYLQYYNKISYNPTGRYRKFLKNVSKAEPYFNKYVEPIEIAGDLSPSLFKGFLYNPSGLDFNNERHRLILAIHFLIFNDRIATTPK